MTIRLIHTSDPAFPFVEQLWLDAFPHCERRPTPDQRHNTDHNPAFHCLLAEESGQPVGFFTCWQFPDFWYGEHFAVSSLYRNRGYGALIMAAVLDYIEHKPLVLEVEMPDNALAQRRIGFYQRQGFQLWDDCPYEQPPYHPEDEPLPMYLMVHGPLTPEAFPAVCTLIHREVYHFG